MDPRIGWCTPEQLGPAFKHWLRIWESSNSSKQGDIIMINNTNPNKPNLEKQQDYIPLQCKSLDVKQGNTPRKRKDCITGDGANKASTYGLNHSSNLDVLVKNKLIPWMRHGKYYHSNPIMW